ncbi:hypothetical protein HN014_11395 [Aquimarina sp. TRL1]|uniref:VOC family protein n=1 Tax=Aquimarina sp. (strain TRL1) TaxID=2736252 RepID=UPI00158B6A19|nr:VOC family protein [Aquimarina sp. TRL1]QKX05495.1 hypothetical protein HN014_11395 [Aquimarina sp. TRL1]
MERLDHVLIRVDNLETGIGDFRKEGFTVYPGEKGYNAMIYFKDHSFIELVAPSRFPGIYTLLARIGFFSLLGTAFRRIGTYAVWKERFLDYSVYSSAIEKQHTDVQNRSSKLLKMNKKNKNGDTIYWRLFAPKERSFPFVMSDYSPYKYPDKTAHTHDNGVEGIEELVISVNENLKSYLERLSTFFNIRLSDFIEGAEMHSLVTSNTRITYVIGNKNKIVRLVLKGENSLPALEKYKVFGIGEKKRK